MLQGLVPLLLTLIVPVVPFVATGRPVQVKSGVPKAPDGFVVELVLHHPDVKWPSAVHCREDGSLLVAEDPMDMPGPTDQPIDRIWLLRFAPDGSVTKTLFAERLFAVMGIQEVDDAVVVMNMPHLTLLRDRDGDGIAEERKELIENLGPPAPGWPGGFNDHIVSGIRLAMDGFLYVSVGDKGIPAAVGRDGSRLTLRGGGVIRVKPDGTQLEIVASGTRNHLDVAIDERDCLFTYDNTDDGLGWWTRLTHVMPGGYYGYPWDYQQHPERMLPCIKDDGGGSPTGGLVYREDAWPEEYRGDLFFCEWADQVVRRFKVARKGASFECTLTEDFVTPGESGEFRPLDVCESADGRCLYIADWNCPGWQSDEVTGRVWRVRRVDDRPGAPPIGGLADGTMASLAKASVDDLVANLAHPAYRRRLAAQRELSRRTAAKDVATGLHARFTDLVLQGGSPTGSDTVADERTLRHLLWAIVQSRGGITTPLAADALGSASADLREQTARALGQKRASDRPLVKILTDLMQHDADPMVRRESAIALGRCRDPLIYWSFVRALDENDDPFVRFAIRQSMRLLDCRWAMLFDRVLPNSKQETRDAVWLALREHYDLELAQALAAATTNTIYTPALRAQALASLAEIHRKRPAWDGKWWQIQPAKSGWPAKTEAWEGTPIAIAAIRAAFDSTWPDVRQAAIEAVRTTREPELFPCVRAAWAKATKEKSEDDGERARLLALLAEVGDRDAVAIFDEGLGSSAASVRAAAVAALERVLGAESLPRVERLLADPGPDPDAGVRDAALAVLARHPQLRNLRHFVGGLSRADVTRADDTRDACRQAIAALRVEARPELEGMATRGELDAGAFATLREIYSEPRPLLEWTLLGPVDRSLRVAAIEQAKPGELAAAFEQGGTLAIRKQATAALPHGFVDLRAQLVDRGDSAAYAFACVESPIARSARCLVGSDDGVMLWVNGALVHDHVVDRGWTPDEDRIEIPLAAGVNELLLRVEQGGGDWSFNVKVSEVPSGPFGELVPPGSPGSGDAPREFDPKAWREFALARAGDAARGKALYFAEQGTGCFRCHAIAGVGPKLGPDLRDVGKKYARAELADSILEPSQKIQEGYTATNVFLKDGDVLSGLLAGEKDGVVLLADANGSVREIRREDVKETRASKVSAMPIGLAEKLTPDEFADLIAWLESLKE